MQLNKRQIGIFSIVTTILNNINTNNLVFKKSLEDFSILIHYFINEEIKAHRF